MILGGVDLNTAKVIQKVKPDIIALGYDQGDIAELIARQGGAGKVVRLKKYGDVSSSMIRKLIYSTNKKQVKAKS